MAQNFYKKKSHIKFTIKWLLGASVADIEMRALRSTAISLQLRKWVMRRRFFDKKMFNNIFPKLFAQRTKEEKCH